MYDLAANDGFVSVGVDHDTPVFAVTSIAAWWKQVGVKRYPDAPSSDWLLVEEIRDLLHLSVGDLAARLGLAYSTVLGKAQERPLSCPPGLREKLHALRREHLAVNGTKL